MDVHTSADDSDRDDRMRLVRYVAFDLEDGF